VHPAEVRGTATFYDMLHTEPVGSGRLGETVPAHGVLSRVERSVGLPAREARSRAEAGQKSGPAAPATGTVPE
jgi:hypothetical protein